MTAYTTPDNLPYPGPDDYDDPADSPLAFGQLAESVQAALTARDFNVRRAGSVRLLTRATITIPDNETTMLGGGWVAAPGDTGQGILSYSNGVLTATQSGYYTVTAYINWAAQFTGLCRLDLYANGSAMFRDERSGTPGRGQTMTVDGQYFAAGTPVQLAVLQQSGATQVINNTRWNMRKVAGT